MKVGSAVRCLLGSSVIGCLVGVVALSGYTLYTLQAVPNTLAQIAIQTERTKFIDRHGEPLNSTFLNVWNVTDQIRLHEVPEFLVQAVVTAEDKRFFHHGGQDWLARVAALYENLKHWSKIRGASTISEQVIRMIRPRPRTVWTRWLEGWEAVRLEQQVSKHEILEFYLNQVPYASNRRGIVQAAQHHFSRDLQSLSELEMLMLAAMIRAPSRLTPSNDKDDLLRAVRQLSLRLECCEEVLSVDETNFSLTDAPRATITVEAPHFLRYVTETIQTKPTQITTTLDGHLQLALEHVLRARLEELKRQNVGTASLLAADYTTGEVLAWVVVSENVDTNRDTYYDAVLLPRQPGSTLKPFLYALALEAGWTAATRIADRPLVEKVETGLHHYKNFSDHFYGEVTLRTALGNSLNTPAVRTLRAIGSENFKQKLKRLGFQHFDKPVSHYGGGLALGNVETNLLGLVEAYGALANKGIYRKFKVLADHPTDAYAEQVFSAEIASLISNILSDTSARSLEFGSGVLDFPNQTAIKTGTSSGPRDTWTIAYDDKFIVGAWMGNLDNRRMRHVTGSTGPALAVRTAFDLLNQNREPSNLWLSPNLVVHEICADSGVKPEEGNTYNTREEYFIRGTEPKIASSDESTAAQDFRIVIPTPELTLAIDPRVPAEYQKLEFLVSGVNARDRIVWQIDNDRYESTGSSFLWTLTSGTHEVAAELYQSDKLVARTEAVEIVVR